MRAATLALAWMAFVALGCSDSANGIAGPSLDASFEESPHDAGSDVFLASCADADCGKCGTCSDEGGVARCVCPWGFALKNGKCVLSPDPCTTTQCPAGKACVPEVDCQPLGSCVPTCDCSNCGNCGPDNTDGRWNDLKQYCGHANASPATKACNKPCPAGQGCIPYSPPICWPKEGCFSM